MLLGKIGTTIGKEIIAWTRANGKSLLATRPVKVNTAGLRLAPKLEGDVVQIHKGVTETNSVKKAGTILNTKTGKQEPITFSELPTNLEERNIYRMYASNQNGEAIGNVSFKKVNHITDDLPTLYIEYFGTAAGYKGIGSEMIRKLVQLSDKLGMNGRITLEACTGHVPRGFRFNGFAEKCKTSAAIMYKKMGFKADDEWTDNELLKEIASGGNGLRRPKGLFGEQDVDIFSSTIMDLSEDAIKRYLEKS